MGSAWLYHSLIGRPILPASCGLFYIWTMGKTTFTQELADAICADLAEGKSLRKACANHGATVQSVLRWNEENKAFADQYAQARVRGYALLADELIQIADDGQNDTYTDENGNERTNQDVIARSRLRVDTRKWMLAKMLPKVYGDKITHQGDENNPVKLEFSWKRDQS